ncbi:hypothetical protein ACFLSZ_05700 [Candidatus Bipolaricaulota bacterium]
MPIEYTLERDGTVVVAQASGVLTLECIASLQKALSEDEGLQSPYSNLLDLRFIEDIQITEQELAKIVENLAIGPKAIGAAKLAIVARQEQTFNLGEKYGAIDKGIEDDVIVFFHVETARKWLGLD